MKQSKFLFIIFVLTFVSPAFAATGVIDTSATNHALVCHDATCADPEPGVINFELVDEPSIIIDSSTGISGRVWGNELGWITMNPTGEGVTFADPDTGVLTGKAWSQVSGWINFAVTGQEVKIDPDTGEFDGWAWTGGPHGGWIKFDCADVDSCVKTTWRLSSDGGSESVSGSSRDFCPNLSGAQASIPQGYTVDSEGDCIKVVDVCPNLFNIQATIPTGYVVDSLGACVPKPVETPAVIDYCPNIPEPQSNVPPGYIVTSQGQCVKPTIIDLCTNLAGNQEVVPKGYTEKSKVCVPDFEDLSEIPQIEEGSVPAVPNMDKIPEVIPSENESPSIDREQLINPIIQSVQNYWHFTTTFTKSLVVHAVEVGAGFLNKIVTSIVRLFK